MILLKLLGFLWTCFVALLSMAIAVLGLMLKIVFVIALIAGLIIFLVKRSN